MGRPPSWAGARTRKTDLVGGLAASTPGHDDTVQPNSNIVNVLTSFDDDCRRGGKCQDRREIPQGYRGPKMPIAVQRGFNFDCVHDGKYHVGCATFRVVHIESSL